MRTSSAPPTPPGEGAPAARTQRASKQDEVTTNDLLVVVLASDNLARAWKRVKSNKGAPGIDGVTVADWPAHARAHWPALREQIEQGRYCPQAVRRVEIRPGRNAHQAIRQVQANVKDGRRIAVDLDLAKFFDTVNHDVLMNLLGQVIADKRLLALIGRYLRAGVLVGGHIDPSDVGTPQGGPVSPLLATSCCTNSTKNWNVEDTDSRATPMTWSSWSKANARVSG